MTFHLKKETYKAKERSGNELISDWQTLTNLYSTYKSGRNVEEVTKREVVELAALVITELDKRKVNQNRDVMSNNTKELYDEAKKISNSLSALNDINEVLPILKDLVDIPINHSFIGVKVEMSDNPTVKVVVRMSEPGKETKDNMEYVVKGLLEDLFGIKEGISFEWNQNPESGTTPLFDLVLRRVDSPIRPLTPLKLAEGDE